MLSTADSHVFAISSGKGGVGKSTLATNIGIAFAQNGHKVCLFDADTNLANINILLGITPLKTLEHFLNHDDSIEDIIINGPGNLDIITGASGLPEFVQLSTQQQNKLTQCLKTLESNYQFLVIDTAAGIDETTIQFILAAPYLVLSITDEPTSLTDAFSLLRVLKHYQFNRSILVIVNMTFSHQIALEAFNRLKKAVKVYLNLSCYFAGYVLIDEQVRQSIVKQQPIIMKDKYSPASQCLSRISKRLLTFFDSQPKGNSSFSDFFSDMTNELYLDEFQLSTLPEVTNEPMLSSIMNNDYKLNNTSNDFQNILLNTCHVARLVGTKKNLQ